MPSYLPVAIVLDQKGHKVHSICSSQTVYEGLQTLAEKNIGALAVIDQGKLIGMFSERDYTRKVALKGKSSKDTLIKDIMTCELTTVTPKTSVEACLNLMTSKHIRHLPVLEDDMILGIVSVGDLVAATLQVQSNHIDDLTRYLTGSLG